MSLRHDRQLVGADLVGEVAVCGDAVGADEDDIDLALAHVIAGGGIGDYVVTDAQPFQFPGAEPRALQAGARLIQQDVKMLASLKGGADTPKAVP